MSGPRDQSDRDFEESRAARMLEQAAHATLFSDQSRPELNVGPQIKVPVGYRLPSLDDDPNLAASAERVKRGEMIDLDAVLQATAAALATRLRDAAVSWMRDVLRAEYTRLYGEPCEYEDAELCDWAYHMGYRMVGVVVPSDPASYKRFVIVCGENRLVAGHIIDVKDFEIVKP